MKTKYPHFYDEAENYIVGSKENQIERFREELTQLDYHTLKYIEGDWDKSEEEYQAIKHRKHDIRLAIKELEQTTLPMETRV